MVAFRAHVRGLQPPGSAEAIKPAPQIFFFFNYYFIIIIIFNLKGDAKIGEHAFCSPGTALCPSVRWLWWHPTQNSIGAIRSRRQGAPLGMGTKKNNNDNLGVMPLSF